MIETKIVQKFGNSGHIVLPKEFIGKKIKFVIGPKTFEDAKSKALEILKPYLENILGVYLYGSYARNEETIDSDIDILVITNNKLKIVSKIYDFSIISITMEEFVNTLRNNAILILPIIKEAKTIINPNLLEKYKEYNFTKRNTKWFIDSTKEILELNKKGLELDFEIGSLVYSLILRIRGLLMIKLILNNGSYSKSLLFYHLKNKGLPTNKIRELYKIYSNESNDIKIEKNNIITKKDIEKLLTIARNLLEEVSKLLK